MRRACCEFRACFVTCNNKLASSLLCVVQSVGQSGVGANVALLPRPWRTRLILEFKTSDPIPSCLPLKDPLFMRTSFTLNAIGPGHALAVRRCACAIEPLSSNSHVTGSGDKLGTGLLIDRGRAEARQLVTKAQLEKTRSSGNRSRPLSLLPGVNSSSFARPACSAATAVRASTATRWASRINGAPVQRLGSFSVFPQEYVDSETSARCYSRKALRHRFSPHVGASGGNVGIVSCAPTDEQRRARRVVGGGQLGY